MNLQYCCWNFSHKGYLQGQKEISEEVDDVKPDRHAMAHHATPNYAMPDSSSPGPEAFESFFLWTRVTAPLLLSGLSTFWGREKEVCWKRFFWKVFRFRLRKILKYLNVVEEKKMFSFPALSFFILLFQSTCEFYLPSIQFSLSLTPHLVS